MATTLAPADAAQVDIIDYEIDDGRFVGTVAINGYFSIDVSDFDPQVSGQMVVNIDVAGPASMDVQNGVVDGDWSFTGDGGLDGNFSAQGLTVTLTGKSTYDAAGSFTGSSEQGRIQGTVNSTTTAEVIIPGPASAFNPGPQTSSASDPLNEVLTDVLAGCSTVVARFDRRLSAEIEDQIPGATVNVQGIVALYDDVTEDEDAAKLASIVTQAAAIDSSSGDPFIDLGSALKLLREVQALQTELAQYSDCPPSKEFFNTLTNVATRVGRRALDAIEANRAQDPDGADAVLSRILPSLIELVVATGSDGSGAAATSGTLARAEQMALDAWLRQLGQSPFDEPTIIRLSTTAVQMGWQFSNGNVEAQDVLILFGAGS